MEAMSETSFREPVSGSAAMMVVFQRPSGALLYSIDARLALARRPIVEAWPFALVIKEGHGITTGGLYTVGDETHDLTHPNPVFLQSRSVPDEEWSRRIQVAGIRLLQGKTRKYLPSQRVAPTC
jgi:hypothetical protein